MKKHERLKENHLIARVIQRRSRVMGAYFTVYHYPNSKAGNRYAVSVGKKFGNAVERNYAKRIVREIIRPIKTELPNLLVVIIVKPPFKAVKFFEQKEELTKLIGQIGKQKQ